MRPLLCGRIIPSTLSSNSRPVRNHRQPANSCARTAHAHRELEQSLGEYGAPAVQFPHLVSICLHTISICTKARFCTREGLVAGHFADEPKPA